jgi:hypothetical protein
MTDQNSLTQPVLANLIAEAQGRLHKTDEQFAKELDFPSATVFTMIREGKLKLPIDKVQALAKSIDYPVGDLLRAVLHEYMPDTLVAIEKIWAPTDMTANERKLIESYRYLAKGRDVVPLVMDGQSIIALVAA